MLSPAKWIAFHPENAGSGLLVWWKGPSSIPFSPPGLLAEGTRFSALEDFTTGRILQFATGMLALALWLGTPFAAAQQTHRHARRRTHRQQQRTRGAVVSKPETSTAGATEPPKSIPQSGMPSLENARPTGNLETLPNQTLTPEATTVPSNAGGIAPQSNAASNGHYTPSQGYTAPTTPGANPSTTQGVPNFATGAQPADFNNPRPVLQPGSNTPSGTQSGNGHRTAGHARARSRRRRKPQ